METFDVYTSIRILDGKADDYRVGPWESVAEAEANIPINERHKGLTVLINIGGSSIDYHFKNGTGNGFLIIKTLGSLILPNMILSGGDNSADLSTGLIITVSPISWLISMITYQILGNTTLNLSARDPTFSRLDIIIATSAGLSVVTGIASASVLDPNLPDGSVVVATILVTPTETVVSPPAPITASNLIPPFQPRRNYLQHEPIAVTGVGIYTAKAKFKSGNSFVAGNWTLRASLSPSVSFSNLTGSPSDNTALNNAFLLKADKTYVDTQDNAINLIITNLKAGSTETIASLRALISALQTSDSNQASQLSQIMALLNSDNTLLDTVQEIVDFIELNRSDLDGILVNKLNKSVYDAFLIQYATDLSGKEPSIAGATASDFWSGAKTWLNFASTVFGSVLPTLTAGVNTPIVAGISIKTAFENLQAQISGASSNLGTKEPIITGTNASDFWSGAKTFLNFASTLFSSILPTLSVGVNTAIIAGNSIKTALENLQAQISVLISGKADKSYVDTQDNAINLIITNLKAGSVETIQSLRDLISALQSSDSSQATQLTQITALLNSDNTLLDTVQEIVDFIELNRSDLDSILVNKLNKSVYDAFLIQYASDLSGKEPTITGSGSASDFWSGTKTFVNFASTVFSSVLPILTAGTNTVISAGMSIKTALQNLQAQISVNATNISGKESSITGTTSADFWSGAKTFLNFASTLFATVLPTLASGVDTPILAGITINQAFANFQTQISGLGTKIGNLGLLTTADKTSIVNAINEVKATVPAGGGGGSTTPVNINLYQSII